jgi:rubrerythrin
MTYEEEKKQIQDFVDANPMYSHDCVSCGKLFVTESRNEDCPVCTFPSSGMRMKLKVVKKETKCQNH